MARHKKTGRKFFAARSKKRLGFFAGVRKFVQVIGRKLNLF